MTTLEVAEKEKRKAALAPRFRRHQIGDIGVSSITVSELAFGVAKTNSKRNAHALEKFLLPLEIMPFTAEASGRCSRSGASPSGRWTC
jgi:tRNA(fMet)-specific endonuclease VapC